MFINRDIYLNKLIDFKNKRLIKVITGIRRCGKSTLFEIYQNYLLKNGVKKNQIRSLNIEDPDNEGLTDYKKLYADIKKNLLPNKMNYIFIDEIQMVKDFQKVADGLFIKKNVDLYLTGSNATVLSGELATLLSGRYIEIQMLPLSFKEYVSSFADKTDLSRKFTNYLSQSSFPYTLELKNKNSINDYLKSIYNAVLIKDVVKRKNISDIAMLESVIRFMADNIGNLSSVKKISDTMTSDGRKISTHTVENYLQGLIDAFVLYKIGRFDTKGKQHLKTNEKYYLVDIGLRYTLLGSKANADEGRKLENIVYLELLRRGYELYIGKVADKEVDFVAIKDGKTKYFQVAQTVRDKNTLRRELEPLNSISDHNSKYIITQDNDPDVSYNGIQQINVIDWLLQ